MAASSACVAPLAMAARTTSSPRSPTAACAVAAARLSPPASSGALSLDAPGATKYITCNADEGDSGTFADRMLMEGDPFMLIEGMIIAGWAVGANDGYVYIRSEYPDAIAGTAGRDRRGRGEAAGSATTCWAAASRSECTCASAPARTSAAKRQRCWKASKGSRGVVRAKPPLPALQGLFGKPTVVNNVLSLATVPAILADGAAAYAALGTGRSRGTQVFQLAGNIARGGIVETAFGITLGELVEELRWRIGQRSAGRGRTGGWPTRRRTCPSIASTCRMDYESFAAADALLGHGGIVVFDDTVDMAAQARFAMEFCAVESCGKCTPCRIGSDPRRRADRQDHSPGEPTAAMQTWPSSSTCAR